MIALSRIAEIVDGTVQGDALFQVSQLMSLESAAADAISFCVDPVTNAALSTSKAGAVMLAPAYEDFFVGNKILVDNPYLAYAKISSVFAAITKSGHPPSIDPATSAGISSTAEIGDNVSIGRFTTIGDNSSIGDDVVIGHGVHIADNVQIGAGCRIENNVVISTRCQIGYNCHLSPAAVIGANGFGYAADGESWHRIEQLGRVIIGNKVDVGANTTIDRGSLGDTTIGHGVKLDNQIQIAHNVEIGENTAIAGCVGIAGSAKIGKRCQIAGRAAILGHLEIADDVTILVNSTVTKSIHRKGEYGSMIPVQTISQWRKNLAIIRRLDKILSGLTDQKASDN